MKIRKFLFVALASMMSVVACTQTPSTLPDGTSAKDLLPSKGQIDSVSYLLGINFGSFIKAYNFGEDINYAKVEQGIKDFVAAKGTQQDSTFNEQFKINPELMNDLFNSFLEKREAYSTKLAEAEQNKFFEENLKKDGVQQTESGLQYIILEPGSDVHPSATDTVTVNYTGSLLDGTVFDKTSGEPAVFPLDRVIPGWTEGLQLLGVGGKAKLFIPSKLGYGAQAVGNIQPNSVLVFDVELLDCAKAADPAEE